MVQPVPTKAFLQRAKAAAMCMAPRAEIRPPPPILPFLLAQNLSSKRIAPTDNMQPKSDDAIWHHRWLKFKGERYDPSILLQAEFAHWMKDKLFVLNVYTAKTSWL